MYHIAICEDENIFLEQTKRMTKEIMDGQGLLCHISCHATAQELLQQIQCDAPDLILLDIILGDQNGVDLAKKMRRDGNQVDIIFTTSSTEFSLEGYQVYPVHYLLKPIMKADLQEAILRAMGKQSEQKQELLFEHREGKARVELSAILYLEAINRDVILHTKEKQLYLKDPLKKYLQELLPKQYFVQCHKSFIVSLSQVRDITRNELELHTGQHIPVGRAFYSHVLARFVDFA